MSSYSSPVVNNRPPQVVDSSFYADIRFDPNTSDPVYIGLNVTRGISQDDASWKVMKFDSDRIQTAYGAWSARVALFS